MDSLQDILGKKDFTPPDEVAAIKDYVRRKYDSSCTVRVEKAAVILSVPSAGLAATLQMEKPKLMQSAGVTKRLIIRIGR